MNLRFSRSGGDLTHEFFSVMEGADLHPHAKGLVEVGDVAEPAVEANIRNWLIG